MTPPDPRSASAPLSWCHVAGVKELCLLKSRLPGTFITDIAKLFVPFHGPLPVAK